VKAEENGYNANRYSWGTNLAVCLFVHKVTSGVLMEEEA
jgi:hypothetical protein